jgi:hypothetical protein
VRIREDKAVRITQFYPSEPKIGRGDSVSLCYGVENARTVRLNPAVERLWPALVRCVSTTPATSTTYTLIAEGEDGRAVSESVRVEVGPPKAKIIEVSVNKLEVSPGEQVVICYKAQNATAVDSGGLRAPMLSVGGGQGTMKSSPNHGCYADHPRATKTYLVRVTGPGGSDSESVTVHVK